MKRKSQRPRPRRRQKKNGKKCGGCGCSQNTFFKGGNCSACNANIQSGGSGFSNPATTVFPASNTAYYPLNNYQNDPTMTQFSSRTEGVPVSNHLNVNGGNNIVVGGRKKSKKMQRMQRRSKKMQRRSKKMQRGGINLGYNAMNSLMGPGNYGSWIGANSQSNPDWNASIFTNPVSTNNTGYNETNKYLA